MQKYLSYDEIHGQHESLGRTLDYILENKNKIADFFSGAGDIVFVACGSSYWMSLSAHKSMKLKTGKRSYAVKAAEVILCPEEFTGLYDNPVFVCPSRSGKTKEVLDAIDALRGMYPGSRVFSVIEYLENELGAKSDMVLNINWAAEQAVCQTRSFSNLYLCFISIAALLGGDDAFIANLREYIKNAPSLYAKHEAVVRGLADASKVKSLVTLGSGLQYGTAVQGAYIVIEVAQFNANYFQLLEYRHGPIVTATAETAVFMCTGACGQNERKIAGEARAAGAKVYAVAPGELDWADYTFAMGGCYAKEIIGLHFTFVMQSFAYYFALSHGRNPDKPGDLVQFIIY